MPLSFRRHSLFSSFQNECFLTRKRGMISFSESSLDRSNSIIILSFLKYVNRFWWRDGIKKHISNICQQEGILNFSLFFRHGNLFPSPEGRADGLEKRNEIGVFAEEGWNWNLKSGGKIS